MHEYLMNYELHVSGHTYYVHALVKANSVNEAFGKMPSRYDHESHSLQPKSCWGRVYFGFLTRKQRRMLHEIAGGIDLDSGTITEHCDWCRSIGDKKVD